MMTFLVLLAMPRLIAQSQEVQQLLLNVEKLAQLKKILVNMYKGYEVVSRGYNTIKDISAGNFNLHKIFLDGLLEVNPLVKKYGRVSDIIQCQVQLVNEYKTALKRFKNSNLFNESELNYLEGIYKELLSKSLQNVNQLGMVLTAGELRMSDDERIKMIDNIYASMLEKLTFLRVFNNENYGLAIQREKEFSEVKRSRQLIGF